MLKRWQIITLNSRLIPIHSDVQAVLSSGFPKKVSPQKFNIAIKDICKSVGIVEVIKGSKKMRILSDWL